MQIVSTRRFAAPKALSTLDSPWSLIYIYEIGSYQFSHNPVGLVSTPSDPVRLNAHSRQHRNSWSSSERLNRVKPLDTDDRWWNPGLVYLELPKKKQAQDKHIPWTAFITQAWPLPGHSPKHGTGNRRYKNEYHNREDEILLRTPRVEIGRLDSKPATSYGLMNYYHYRINT